MDKHAYNAPELEEFGSVADLTQTGRTTPGDDTWPGRADHEPGSITHNNAGGNN